MNLKDLLRPGKKYTICMFERDTLHNPFMSYQHFTLGHIALKVYNHVKGYILVKTGSAKDLGPHKFIHLFGTDQYVIWEGTVRVNTSRCVRTVKQDTEFGLMQIKQCYPAMDSRYMLRAKDEVSKAPVAYFIKPLQPELFINYECTS